MLIDSLKAIYLIPISQVNLENKNNGNYKEPILISGRRGYSSYKKTSFYRYSGEYNNILVYNQHKKTKDIVFNKKVFISEFSNRIINKKHYIIMFGVIEDSNKDNKLNNDDLGGLFIYDIEGKELLEFNIPELNLVDYYEPFNTGKLLIRYAVDKNKNGEINYLQEPIIIKELNFSTWELKEFVSKEKINNLTTLIN
jgi:hypothetical protein